jgi:hypothetical protein
MIAILPLLPIVFHLLINTGSVGACCSEKVVGGRFAAPVEPGTTNERKQHVSK